MNPLFRSQLTKGKKFILPLTSLPQHSMKSIYRPTLSSPMLTQIAPMTSFVSRFFTNQFQSVEKLNNEFLNNPNPVIVVNYIKSLNNKKIYSREAFQVLQAGWQSNKLPFNEETLREFLRAAQLANRLDAIDTRALLEYAKKSGNEDLSHLTAELTNSATNGATSVSIPLSNFSALPFGSIPSNGSQFNVPGSSNRFPLFVTYPSISFSDHLWRLFRDVIKILILLAFVAVFIEEESGNISSRIGLNSNKESVISPAEKSDKRFTDVIGIDEAKSDLEEIVMYLKDPKLFTRLGGHLPKGVLLTGPPGTGKTLLARAVAGEADVPFYYTSGSEFEEMYVGVGAKRVRELFKQAKLNKPCIIFIDEIDAIGSRRNSKDQASLRMTLNQLLVEMDGFEQNNGVIIIGATNFVESLDHALRRPGRFDKIVDVPMPDVGGRKAILEFYSKKVPLDEDVDLDQLARGTPGFSGAELYNLINQAALRASVGGLKKVTMHTLEYAKDKILMGAERTSAIISPETMKLTAYHEAGHALIALKTEGSHPIHKATITPRGRSLGMVMQLPEGDQTSITRQQMLANMDVCMGGRVAEELVFGPSKVTTGASSDISQATKIAHSMVTRYGLVDSIGPRLVDNDTKISNRSQEDIDDAVKKLLFDSYNRAKNVLETNRKELEVIAAGLLEYESLSGGEIVDLIGGKPINSLKRSQKTSRASSSIEEMKARDGKPAPAPVANNSTLKARLHTPPPSSNNGPVAIKETPTTKGEEKKEDNKEASTTNKRGPPRE